jgi:propane monooxygenase reductase subunit
VHELASEYLVSGEMDDFEVYMCGPPPMIDAATELLTDRGLDESRIHYDKFTIAADAAERSEA